MKDRDQNWLLNFCFAYTLIMFVFLNYAAVLPLVQREWGISNAAAGTIFSAYQVGYILSAVLLTYLTDRFNAKYIFICSAFWSVITNALFALFATEVYSAVILRGLAGIGMGGTYMPGLKLVAERFGSEKRGRAVGFYTSAFVFGASLSVLISGLVASMAGWRLAIFTTAMGTLIGAVMSVEALKDVSFLPQPQPEQGLRGEVLRNGPALLMIISYAAHMWEMYGMRGWMAAYLTANYLKVGYTSGKATGIAATFTAFIVAIGGFATSIAGYFSDRIGRTNTIGIIMSLSAIHSFTFGWLFGLPLPLVILLGFSYSFFVVAESPVQSTGLTELVNPRYLGAALGLQTLFGFLAASVSPAFFGYVLDITNSASPGKSIASVKTWGWAFSALGVGAIIGPLAMILIRYFPESQRMAGGKK